VLTVRVRAEEGHLRCDIEDDGVGLPGDWREGTGIGATRARLHGLYGVDATLDLARRAEGGTRVTAVFPLEATGPTSPAAMHTGAHAQ